MELILDLIETALDWGLVALLIWAGVICARDSLAAERRNAASPKTPPRRELREHHESWFALRD